MGREESENNSKSSFIKTQKVKSVSSLNDTAIQASHCGAMKVLQFYNSNLNWGKK